MLVREEKARENLEGGRVHVSRAKAHYMETLVDNRALDVPE